MASARIYHFPRSARKRLVPPMSPRTISRVSYGFNGSGFVLLWCATLVTAFSYLTGMAGMARHDVAYGSLLAIVWGLYFAHEPLLKTRIGPLLRLAGLWLVSGSAVSFFGFVLWLVLSHP